MKELKKFSCLSLGAKFIYKNDKEEQIWVKISHELVAKWDFEQQDTNWIGQPVCSFNDSGQDDDVLHFVETTLSDNPSLGPGPCVY